ncbi:hypothetical protein APHAL10511_004767 [Amanita phalloides]|nr:hypothetical protein APHAL10511_004767 [Amanita phalloides]
MTILLNADREYVTHERIPLEMDLCDLLQNMKLHYPANDKTAIGAPFAIGRQSEAAVAGDVIMPDEMSYQSDGESSQSSEPAGSTDEDYGCAYLQSIKSRLDLFTTTGGGYLEAIFTHREICGAYPAGHTQCPRALSDIACALEQRAWRADREADGEAISTFRQEAWFIANMASSVMHRW